MIQITLPGTPEITELRGQFIRDDVELLTAPRLVESKYHALANVNGWLCVVELIARPEACAVLAGEEP